MEEYNYLSSYGDYGTPTSFIPKKTVDDLTANAPKELDTFKEVADKIGEIEGGGSSTDISELTEKIEAVETSVSDLSEEVDKKIESVTIEKDQDNSLVYNLLVDGTVVGQINIPKDQFLKHAEYNASTKEIELTCETSDGESVVKVDVSDLVDTYSAGNGLALENNVFSIKLNPESEEYLTVDQNGLKLSGLNNFITMADVEAKGYSTFDGSYNSLTDTPTIPQKVEELEDASDYAKVNDIPTKLTDLDNDGNFVTDENYSHIDNNFSNEDKDKLDGIEPRAKANVQSDWNESDTESDAFILNKPTNVSDFANDANYITANDAVSDVIYDSAERKLQKSVNGETTDVVSFATVAITGSYNDLEDKPTIPAGVQVDDNITENGENAVKGGAIFTALSGKVDTVENMSLMSQEEHTKLEGIEANANNYDDSALSNRVTTLENAGYITSYVDTAVSNLDVVEDEDEGKLLVVTSTDGTNESSVSVKASKIFDHEQYFTKDETRSIFVDDSEASTLINAAVAPKANTADLNSAVYELVIRLNKLEAQNRVLVEKNTDSADDINGMTDNEAENADIVVASDDAIAALSGGKTFNSVTIAGGELGGSTVLNFSAKENIDIDGLTVSGTKGTGHGKIVYGANDVVISNVNIEPGCTVYNVFEGKQDKSQDNSIDNFTATNVNVDSTDLTHNVFNIYQVNEGANIIIKDSSFNLDVANSNVMRISNITNAKNVTITFENVDWNYENKPYGDSDLEWAGLLIYQPYGSDVAFNADFTNTKTWTINVKNCRYNGKHITSNAVGTIEQVIYQYNINNGGVSEAPTAFGDNINFE